MQSHRVAAGTLEAGEGVTGNKRDEDSFFQSSPRQTGPEHGQTPKPCKQCQGPGIRGVSSRVEKGPGPYPPLLEKVPVDRAEKPCFCFHDNFLRAAVTFISGAMTKTVICSWLKFNK